MQISDLVLYHASKNDTEACASIMQACHNSFYIETCLRSIAVMPHTVNMAEIDENVDIYHGENAYRFLLEVACGLRSAIKGEPEVFSQLKRSWNSYYDESGPFAASLRGVMQSIFRDTKRIRSTYLENMGGSSYYSATEKLIDLKKGETLLLIGAGEFSNTLAHCMIKRVDHLIVANRSAKKLEQIRSELAEWKNKLTLTTLEDAIENHIYTADHVLVCVPSGTDTDLDQAIISNWESRHRHHKHGYLVHYCEEVSANTDWEALPKFYNLTDIMQYQSHRTEAQEQAVMLAQGACAELSEYQKTKPDAQPKAPDTKASTLSGSHFSRLLKRKRP